MIWITAPAGSGKTCLLNQWIDSARSGPVVWLTLDRFDRETVWLFNRLLRGVDLVGLHQARRRLMRAGDDGPAVLSATMQALDRCSGQLTLVFDDVHEISGSPAERALEHLIHHGPANVLVVGAGRHHCDLRLSRLVVANELALIDGRSLACDEEEARRMLRSAGATVDPATAAGLTAHHHGWVAGLRLAAQDLGKQDRGADPVGPGSRRVIHDYLQEEVIERLPPAVRRFLLRTCVADELNDDLAADLAADDLAGAIWDRLHQEGFFLAPQGSRDGWFRYQPALRDVLLDTLGRRAPRELNDLYDRAAAWSARNDRIRPALDYATRAGNHALAATLLVEHGWSLLLDGRSDAVAGTRREWPGNQGAVHPELPAVLALLRLYSDQPRLTGPPPDPVVVPSGSPRNEGLQAAPDHITEPPFQVNYHRRQCIETSARLLGALSRGDDTRLVLAEADSLLQRFRARPPTGATTHWVNLLTYYTALGHAIDDNAGAARMFHRGGAGLFGPETAGLRRRLLGWQALALAGAGDLRAAEDAAEEVGGAEDMHPDQVSGLLADLARAVIHLHRGQVTEAVHLADTVSASTVKQRLARPIRLVIGMLTDVLHARFHLLLRDHASVYARLADVRRSAVGRLPLVQRLLAAVETRVLYQLRDRPEQLCRFGVDRHRPLADRMVTGVDLARLALAQGEAASALTVAGRLLDRADTGSLVDRVDARLIVAVAHRRQGRDDIAAEHLGHALRLAGPERLVLPFVEGGTDIEVLLTTHFTATGVHSALRERLLRVFGVGKAGLASVPRPPLDALTDSETTVLRFLPSLLVNEEIAGQLHISVNTVKTHLRSIYRKLGVSNRRGAVAVAREVGIL